MNTRLISNEGKRAAATALDSARQTRGYEGRTAQGGNRESRPFVFGRRIAAVILSALLLAAILPACVAEDASALVENQWNYIDASMDVSNGIPEDATGRLARIRDVGKLTVATEPYYPPQEFIDETQEGQARFAGADMELARLIAERMGVELEIVPLELSEVITSVGDGKYDLAISALAFTTGRAMVLEMSKGYYFTDEKASTGVIIREERSEEIQSVDDLAGRDIVAQSGSLQETMGVENIDYRKFRRATTVNDVYEAIIAGREDAGVVDLENARTYIETHPDCGLMIVPDLFFELAPQYEGDRVAAPKGEIELICFVNGVIDEVVESGQYERWFEQYQTETAQN